MALMLIYVLAPLSDNLILPVGFLLGYINDMIFSPMGPYMNELFPTAVRGVDEGFCYNVGRGIGHYFQRRSVFWHSDLVWGRRSLY